MTSANVGIGPPGEPAPANRPGIESGSPGGRGQRSVQATFGIMRHGIRQRWALSVGLLFVGTASVVALGADLLSPASRGGLQFAPLLPPNSDNWFGTDDLGRDVFHQFVHGARVSLAIGLLAAFMSTVLGVSIGLAAGYRGGLIDDLLMRFTEATQVAPTFFLALVMAALFGPSLTNIVIIIAILSWPEIARLVRAETLSVRERDYVAAARSIGSPHLRVMVRTVLPNVVGVALVAGSLQVSYAILLESSLSFLGLGDPSVPSWGLMLHGSQRLLQVAWWLSLIPGLGILCASLGFNLIGDGFNDLLNPRRSRS